MSDKSRQVFHVVLVLRLSYASGRDILYGISQYARRRCRWRMHVVNFRGDATADELREVVSSGGVDGIIANGADNPSVADVLEASGVPLVVIGAKPPGMKRTKALSFVRNDDVAIGRKAAEYLASLGRFSSYGFVARNTDAFNYISELREKGFRAGLERIAADIRLYETAASVARGSYEDIAALGEWLKHLPKPAAVMAAYDLRATHVVEAASAAGLRIPDDIALVGVDNDELLCETSEPTLTSVAPDHVSLGELAAAALRKMLARPSASHPETLLPIKKVVERRSSRHIEPSTHLVERASAYIRQNATKGIRAADVVRHLGVSRRLADLRFRQLTGGTILQAILKARLLALQRKLQETDAPIAKLSASYGFRSENYAKRLFRSRFGMSMTEWRAKSAATHSSIPKILD